MISALNPAVMRENVFKTFPPRHFNEPTIDSYSGSAESNLLNIGTLPVDDNEKQGFGEDRDLNAQDAEDSYVNDTFESKVAGSAQVSKVHITAHNVSNH